MVEYHDILWDIASAKKSNLAYMDVIYNTRAPLAAFLVWRDLRVMEEISWYGWFIDYWMEGGMCDVCSVMPVLTMCNVCLLTS